MWVVFLILGLALLLVVAIIIIAIRYKRDYWKFLDIPHEQPKKMLEIFHEMRAMDAVGEQPTDVELEHITALYKRFKGTGPFCGFYQLLRPTVLVLERELCRQILIKDFANFNDRGHYYNRKHDPLSAHLFNLRGQSWLQVRPRLEHTLSVAGIRSIYEGLERACQNLLANFEAALLNNEATTLKMQPLIARYVCNTLATCVFGLSDANEKYPLTQFYSMIEEAVMTPKRHGRYVQGLVYRYPDFGKKIGLSMTPHKVHDYFMSLITDLVKERELSKATSGDYMQLLINMKREQFRTHESNDDNTDSETTLQQRLMNELAAHAFGFLHTSYEPTVLTLSFALLELALQPELQSRVRQELQAAMQRHDDLINYECVMELELLGQVLQETIRMHPVVPYLTRKTLHDYHVTSNSKYLLTKNLFVIIPIHAIHNDAAYFPEPHLFRPERFSEQATRDSCTWLGFGEGPRNCIAMHFAQVQMRLTLAQLLKRFEYRIDTAQPMPSLEHGLELLVQRISA